MPKSTPSPTNSGMNATEIRLSWPTASSPSAVVTIRPAMVVPRIAVTIRHERIASQSVSSIAKIIAPPTSQA